MQVPNIIKSEKWKHFFLGSFFGSLLAYLIFLYMYGVMQEELLQKHVELTTEIKKLEQRNSTLLEDKKQLDHLTKKETTVTNIHIHITNGKKLKLDRLLLYQLEEKISDEISHLIGTPVHNISKSDTLLISTIENKTFTVDEFSYQMEVNKLIISTKLTLEVTALLPGST